MLFTGEFMRYAGVAIALHFLLLSAAADEVSIGVVESEPGLAARLAAAVAAALGEGQVSVAAVEPDEPLSLPPHLCLQASEGASAALSSAVATAAATRAGVPLLLTAPAPPALLADPAPLQLYPHPNDLAEACAALCADKGWQGAVLLHEGGAAGVARLAPDSESLALVPRRLPPAHDDALLRNLLLVLKKYGASNFVVWCSAECARRVLDAAQRVGLLGERHAYIVLALDAHTVPLAEFSYGGANITVVQLYDPEAPEVVEAMKEWSAAYRQRMNNAVNETEIEEAFDKIIIDVMRENCNVQVMSNPPTSLVLAYDAARIVRQSLERLQLPAAAHGSCEHGNADFHADTLLNYIRSEEWEGAGGPLLWGADGAREAVRLQAAELAPGGRLISAAAWTRSAGLSWDPRPPGPPLPDDVMTNRTFTILIAMNDPYVMRRQSTTRLLGNARYEGFCIELIEQLAEQLNFNYTFREATGSYGKYNKTTKQWDGMMRTLIDDPSVDFAITDLTITAEREQGVDFTTPFMNLGITILFRTPETPKPALFAFLRPFSNGVWLCLGFAYLATSLVLYVVGRLCPEEWQNPYPCVEDPPALENQFTLANALWFNLGAVLLQGSEIAPVAYGSRAVASVWWLFALVITSSYTANLATLLADKSSTPLFNNVQELADYADELGITYGAMLGGSTWTFFEQSKNELYKRMFANMKPEDMPKSNKEGFQKVKTDRYAFFAESTTIEYKIERDCEVTKVGDLLDSKGYGLAMKKGSQYRQALNVKLLSLQEAGTLREMKHRWWNEEHGGGACTESDERENEELTMDNFLGLFVVLAVGCALGVGVSCCDLAWAARQPRGDEPYSHRLWAELRFVFRFEQSVKPLRGSLSPPTTDQSIERCTSADNTPPGSAGSDIAAGEGNVQAEGGAEAGTPCGMRLRSPSLRSASARRSSMHMASLRRARHLTAQSSVQR